MARLRKRKNGRATGQIAEESGPVGKKLNQAPPLLPEGMASLCKRGQEPGSNLFSWPTTLDPLPLALAPTKRQNYSRGRCALANDRVPAEDHAPVEDRAGAEEEHAAALEGDCCWGRMYQG